jgi:hypothetical protein
MLRELLASDTLAHLRPLTGDDTQLVARRFRSNIMVETEPGVGDSLRRRAAPGRAMG